MLGQPATRFLLGKKRTSGGICDCPSLKLTRFSPAPCQQPGPRDHRLLLEQQPQPPKESPWCHACTPSLCCSHSSQRDLLKAQMKQNEQWRTLTHNPPHTHYISPTSALGRKFNHLNDTCSALQGPCHAFTPATQHPSLLRNATSSETLSSVTNLPKASFILTFYFITLFLWGQLSASINSVT